MARPSYLVLEQVADALGIGHDEVLGLVEDGKLPVVHLSESKTVVTGAALAAYRRRQAGEEPSLPPVPQAMTDIAGGIAAFHKDTGHTPSEWLRRWHRDELEDSDNNMALTVLAGALRDAELRQRLLPWNKDKSKVPTGGDGLT